MSDFWQGQHPWNTFRDAPTWDRATDEAARRREREAQQRFDEMRRRDESPRGAEFVQQAIQHQYER